ncbi:NAD+ synthase [Candidatus Sumerlaeota bacterium]|nr:NAD+ synthase [Candidatus Sumerlaeota bacterium]
MIRIALAQINVTVGDLEGNTARAIEAVREAGRGGADLVILPEQTIPGYPAKDLLTQKHFVRRCGSALERFAKETAGGAASLIGFPEAHAGQGHGVYNAAALCRGGVVEMVYRKWLLPTYDVFDEDRYFDEGSSVALFDLKGKRVAITVCEDLWNDELYWSHRRYQRDPIRACMDAGAEMIVSMSASPFSLGKPAVRGAMFGAAARSHKVPIAVTNAVGGNDDLIFDGGSAVFGADGGAIAQARLFTDELVYGDVFSSGASGKVAVVGDELTQLREALVLGVRDYVRKCGFQRVLIGLSGGIDSALVAVLAADALGAENVHGVAMPSRYSSEHSITDARKLAENLGIKFSLIPIEEMFQAALSQLAPNLEERGRQIAEENLQSRLRGMTLMALSNASGDLVLTTGNKSELSVGYCTLYGDMCGGLSVIGDVPKTMVYSLSRFINERAGRALIPEDTLTKPPSAELRPDQKDTDSLPPYDILDPIIRGYTEESLDADALIARGHDAATVRRVIRMIEVNEYKRRQSPPVLKVTSRAFGAGWRMPIARR